SDNADRRDCGPKAHLHTRPDPMGYRDGANPYAYTSGDPINKVDAFGLYQIEIHYYMTYFLAIAAGMKSEDALTLALGAQYVDDNPITQPLNLTSPFTQTARLQRNHFNLRKHQDRYLD